MKRLLIISAFLTLIACVFPLCMALARPIAPVGTVQEAEEEAEEDDALPPPDEMTFGVDADTVLTFSDGGDSRVITMADYIVGAVSAEMPAKFEPDALMAQAVALRTYALYKLRVDPSSAHTENVCSSSACCAAWKSEAELREKWGDKYDEFIRRIYNAVAATDGVYIAYDGAPALAAFHSSSPGATEASGEVWSSALPYLVSVKSPETAEDVPNFVSTVTVSADEFAAQIKKHFPAADFSVPANKWISAPVYDAAGRLKTVSVGGTDVSGTKLRSIFSLRSAAISIDCTADGVTMTATGYGHGVGMSQYGANVMAQSGSTWQEILAWYYPGTELVFPESAPDEVESSPAVGENSTDSDNTSSTAQQNS